MDSRQGSIVADGGGFRCSVCNGGVRRDATSCKHCGAQFTDDPVPVTPTPNILSQINTALKTSPKETTMTTAKVIYDNAGQLQQIEAALLPGERIEAVLDCKGGGTGFVGITDKRVIFQDKQFLRKIKAVVSIPYSRITTIATHDEAGLLTGRGFFSSSKITITTSHGDWEFEFRGADKAHAAHNLILAHMV